MMVSLLGNQGCIVMSVTLTYVIMYHKVIIEVTVQ